MHFEGGAPIKGKKKGDPREIKTPLTKKQRALIEENAPNIERLYGWVSQRVRRKVALEHAGYPKDLLDICRQQVNQTAMASARTWRKGQATFASYLTEMRFAICGHAIRAWFVLEKLKATKSNLVTRRFLPEHSQHRDERSTKDQERAQPTLAHVLSGESKGVARVLLAQLPKKEAEVLRLRYGIGCPRLDLQETASRLSLLRSEVRVLEAGALKRLGALKNEGMPKVSNKETARVLDAPLRKAGRRG